MKTSSLWKTIAVVSVLMLNHYILLSQCYSVTISTQTEMNNFSCDTVDHLDIYNNSATDPIVDYSKLDTLKLINQNLSFNNFNYGNNVIEFKNLLKVGSIYCGEIGQLSKLKFHKLDTITYTVSINNSSLSVLSFDSLKTAGTIQIEVNNLDTIAINKLNNVRNLFLYGLSAETYLSYFENLVSIEEFLLFGSTINNTAFLPDSINIKTMRLTNNPNLNMVNQLVNKQIIQSVVIQDCDNIDLNIFNSILHANTIDIREHNNLIDLHFLKNLKTAHTLLFIQNDNLINLDSLRNIEFVSQFFILNNPNLEACCFARKLFDERKVLEIFFTRNGQFCSSISDIFAYCVDDDKDNVFLPEDNCPNKYNPQQVDTDSDGRGNACDNCPGAINVSQSDVDLDGIGDVCDDFPNGGDPAVNTQNADIVIDQNIRGVILKNELGDCYRLKVGANGELLTVKITCP